MTPTDPGIARGPIRSLLFFLPFVGGAIPLIAVALGTWGSHLDWQARAATWEQSPGCDTDPTGPSSDQGCAWRQATFVAADSVEDDSGDAPTDTYVLTFQIGGATTDREEIPSESTWGCVSQGDQVSVEMWRGHVTQVAYGGDRFPTESNPSYRRAHPSALLLLVLPVSSLDSHVPFPDASGVPPLKRNDCRARCLRSPFSPLTARFVPTAVLKTA